MIVPSYGKRALVVISVVATLYFYIGSLIYGEGFYGRFWDRKFSELSYRLDGLFFLFDEHTYLVILVAFGALVLAAATSKYRERIWPLPRPDEPTARDRQTSDAMQLMRS